MGGEKISRGQPKKPETGAFGFKLFLFIDHPRFFSQSMLRQEEIIAERYEKRKEAQRRRNIKRRLREKKKQEAKRLNC